MKRPIAALAVAFLAVLPPVANAAPAIGPAVASLTVVGHGTIERAPDVARIAIEIVTNDADAARSGAQNNAIEKAFRDRLQRLGIAPSDVRTTSFNVQFVPYPPKDLPAENRQARYGYVTTRGIGISVSPLEKAGEIVDAAAASGITQIGDVSFDIRDRRPAVLDALAAATADARARAAALATAAGVRLDRIVTITTDDIEPIRPGNASMMRMTAGPAVPTTFTPGPLTVDASVTLTYDIR